MKKAKKLTAVLLAALMAASAVSGCSQETATETSSAGTESSSGSSSSEASSSEAAPVEQEPVSLEGWGVATFDGTTGIQSYNDQIAWQQIEEETGIHVDWTITTDGETQLGLLMASGDLPDIMVGVKAQLFEDYGMQGALMPLEDLIDQYIPSLQAIIEEDPTVGGSITSADGHIYFFPRVLGDVGTRCWAGWMIRGDWLEQVGMEVPTTTDELYEVLKAFKEQLGADRALSGNPRSLIWAFGVGSRGEGNKVHDMFLEDGEIKFGPTDPRYREAAEYMNKLYSEGLLDPEWNTFTGASNEQVTTGVMTDEVGVLYGSYSGVLGTNNSLMQQDRGVEPFISMAPLAGPDGEAAIQGMHTSIDSGKGGAIASTTEHAEDIARLFEYTYSDKRYELYFGTEGDTYTIEDGVYTYTDKVTKSNIGTMQYVNNYIFDLSNYPSDYPLEVYQSILTDEGKRGNEITTEKCGDIKVPELRFSAEENARTTSLLRDINTYVDENLAAFVNGERDFSEWDAYMDELESLGVSELAEIYNTSYQRFLEATA